MSAYGNNSRKQTAPLTDTFFNSRGCPLTRELTVVFFRARQNSCWTCYSSVKCRKALWLHAARHCGLIANGRNQENRDAHHFKYSYMPCSFDISSIIFSWRLLSEELVSPQCIKRGASGSVSMARDFLNRYKMRENAFCIDCPGTYTYRCLVRMRRRLCYEQVCRYEIKASNSLISNAWRRHHLGRIWLTYGGTQPE